MPEATKQERFGVFLERLEIAHAASSAEDALRLIGETLNAVENEMTDIPYDPAKFETDGRLYPPEADAAHPVADHPSVTRYRSRKHNTFISANGAIEIQDLDEQVWLAKPGADGNGVWT